MIVVIGSANLDFVTQAPTIPRPGETVMGRDLAMFPGGKGANQAVACAKAGGAETCFIGALGDDAFAQTLREALQDAGVRDHIIACPSTPTGAAFICVSDAGENAITVAPGANHSLTPERAATALRPLLASGRCRYLLLQAEIPMATNVAVAQMAREAGIRVAFNAAPASHLPPALLKCIDVLIVNALELETIAQTLGIAAKDVEAQVQALSTPLVVVTLGATGCLVHDRELGLQHCPTFSVEVVDTTGAGDAFAGAFVAALNEGATSIAAAQFANAVGALACTALGAQSSTPRLADVQAFLTAQA